MKFRHKTIRCEWQVVSQEVDQYGMSGPRSERVVHSTWPDYDEARADLPNWGTESPFVPGRWFPKDAKHGYMLLEVQYREVVVEEFLA